MWVLVLGAELRRVEFCRSENLQHSVQSLSHRHRTALLSRVNDVYHLDEQTHKMLVEKLDGECPSLEHHVLTINTMAGEPHPRDTLPISTNTNVMLKQMAHMQLRILPPFRSIPVGGV